MKIKLNKRSSFQGETTVLLKAPCVQWQETFQWQNLRGEEKEEIRNRKEEETRWSPNNTFGLAVINVYHSSYTRSNTINQDVSFLLSSLEEVNIYDNVRMRHAGARRTSVSFCDCGSLIWRCFPAQTTRVHHSVQPSKQTAAVAPSLDWAVNCCGANRSRHPCRWTRGVQSEFRLFPETVE